MSGIHYSDCGGEDLPGELAFSFEEGFSGPSVPETQSLGDLIGDDGVDDFRCEEIWREMEAVAEEVMQIVPPEEGSEPEVLQ